MSAERRDSHPNLFSPDAINNQANALASLLLGENGGLARFTDSKAIVERYGYKYEASTRLVTLDGKSLTSTTHFKLEDSNPSTLPITPIIDHEVTIYGRDEQGGDVSATYTQLNSQERAYYLYKMTTGESEYATFDSNPLTVEAQVNLASILGLPTEIN